MAPQPIASPGYSITLYLKLSDYPLTVGRRALDAAQALYEQVRQALESGQPRLLELSDEINPYTRYSLLTSELVAVGLESRTPGAVYATYLESASLTNSIDDDRLNGSAIAIDLKAEISSLLGSYKAGTVKAYTSEGKAGSIIGTENGDVLTNARGLHDIEGLGKADIFAIVVAEKFGKKNADRIVDFDLVEGDVIALSSEALKGLGSIKFATANSRRELKRLKTTESTIIYDKPRGDLFYNSNVEEPGLGRDGGLFGRLLNSPALSEESFILL